MGRLVHTGLGSSSLVAHVLPYPPPPHVNSFVLGPAVINTHPTCVCVYYCRTYYKAVRVGEEESGGHVL
jgi:hypothetical protein